MAVLSKKNQRKLVKSLTLMKISASYLEPPAKGLGFASVSLAGKAKLIKFAHSRNKGFIA